MTSRLGKVAVAMCLLLACMVGDGASQDGPGWNPAGAAAYLDARRDDWFGWSIAKRGLDENRTSCVCCHTLVPYGMARAQLRKLQNVADPVAGEQALLAQTKKRTANFAQLDTPQFRLLYDNSSTLKAQSRGTEAVLNAVILAFDDANAGRTEPSESTRRAFDNLWATQVASGNNEGSWDWLDFSLQPWETETARYYGAALAALAVGTAPGYYGPNAPAAVQEHVTKLRNYLTSHAASESTYNRLWLLLASTRLDGLLSEAGRNQIIDELYALRNVAEGGWSLSSLGTFPHETPASDGYATGLIVYAFQCAGLGRDDPKVAPGIAWLKANQKPTGEWRATSVNVERDFATRSGKFMSDAATAFAVLALIPRPAE